MYVSPEQATGDPRLDARSDLYSLGVVAYEMLAGQPPFTYRSQEAMLAAHRSELPPPMTAQRTDVPAWLAQLVMRLLEKRPADRPQTADEVLRLLDSSVTVCVGAPAVARARRQPFAAAATIALIIALAIAAGTYVSLVDHRTATMMRTTPSQVHSP